MDYTYEEIIKGINEGTLDEVRFAIPSYPHYRDCVLRRVYLEINGIKSFECIEMRLTKDGSEKSLYYGLFKYKEKLFNIKGKGRFTFKEIFNRIEIKEVIKHS